MRVFANALSVASFALLCVSFGVLVRTAGWHVALGAAGVVFSFSMERVARDIGRGAS